MKRAVGAGFIFTIICIVMLIVKACAPDEPARPQPNQPTPKRQLLNPKLFKPKPTIDHNASPGLTRFEAPGPKRSSTMEPDGYYFYESPGPRQYGAIECPDPRLAVDLPAELRLWYRNPDGSCVQCSLGMCGVDQNVPQASTLLWRTEYGDPVRGGSGPARVAAYCDRRGIAAYNITGSKTWDWMRWAVASGRGAAIGAGGSHFQTLMGYDERTGTWYVCNNNSPHRIDEYTEAGFRRLHLASGQWVVILKGPPAPARAQYFRWW